MKLDWSCHSCLPRRELPSATTRNCVVSQLRIFWRRVNHFQPANHTNSLSVSRFRTGPASPYPVMGYSVMGCNVRHDLDPQRRIPSIPGKVERGAKGSKAHSTTGSFDAGSSSVLDFKIRIRREKSGCSRTEALCHALQEVVEMVCEVKTSRVAVTLYC